MGEENSTQREQKAQRLKKLHASKLQEGLHLRSYENLIFNDFPR